MRWLFLSMEFKVNIAPFMPDDVIRLVNKCQINSHICAFYNSAEERNMIASHFLFAGLIKGERVIYIDSDENNNAIKSALYKLSIDVDSTIASGQLSILDRKQSYFEQGYFDGNHMIERWKHSTDLAIKENYPGLRAAGDVPCQDETGDMLDKVLQYEVELNNFFPKNKALALCLYNRSLFPEEVLSKILFAHPMVMHNKTICYNSFYVSPDEFSPTLEADQKLDTLLEQSWNQNKKEANNLEYL